MDKYLTPNAQKAMNYHKTIVDDLNQTKDWYRIINKPEREINAFQTFFNDVTELDGGMFLQPLRMSDMEMMYPSLISQIPNRGSNNYLYIFTCNNALGNGQALIAHNIMTMQN
jgi:hypothetical protein